MFGTWHQGTPEEFAAEIDSCWAKLLPGEKDFSAFAGTRVSDGSEKQPLCQDALSGLELSKVQEALSYFHANLAMPGNEPPRFPDEASVKAELANWSPAAVVSAYRKLS